MDSILSIKGLHFAYQGNQVLREVDMEVPQGSVFGYLGKNGAGKIYHHKAVIGIASDREGRDFFSRC